LSRQSQIQTFVSNARKNLFPEPVDLKPAGFVGLMNMGTGKTVEISEKAVKQMSATPAPSFSGFTNVGLKREVNVDPKALEAVKNNKTRPTVQPANHIIKSGFTTGLGQHVKISEEAIQKSKISTNNFKHTLPLPDFTRNRFRKIFHLLLFRRVKLSKTDSLDLIYPNIKLNFFFKFVKL